MAVQDTVAPARRTAARTSGAFIQAVTAFALLVGTASVSAQALYTWETFEKRVTSANSVSALGNDLFGDSVSLQNGALSFTVTDVSLPGNDSLAVEFTRTYSVQNRKSQSFNEMLADWRPQLPRLSGTFAPDWTVQGTSKSRCSDTRGPLLPTEFQGVFQLADYWQGVQLELPGGGGGEVLISAPGLAKPADGGTYLWTTNGQTQLSCLQSIKNGTGSGDEGFLAVTSDGTKYWFDWMAQRAVPGQLAKISPPSGGQPITHLMTLRENSLYATRVEDRYGNWVEYTYDNAANAPARLKQIRANDGRQLTLSYTTANPLRINTVSDGTRTWTYGYGVDSSPATRPILNSVTLPDTRKWLINFSSLSHSPFDYTMTDGAERGCQWVAWPNNADQEPTGIITHPSGAVGTFKVGVVEHGRSNVTVTCSNVTTYPYNAAPGTNNDPTDDQPMFVLSYLAWSLSSKSISGPGISTQSWTYTYEGDISGHYYPGSSPTFPVCFGAQCFQPICTTDACAGTNRTLVTAPDGSWQRYVFGNSWQYNEGKLLRIETGAQGSPALRTTTNTYDLSRTDSTYLARFGMSQRYSADGFDAEYHRPQLGSVITQQGTTFSWQVDTCGPSRCMDAWARPTSVTRSSSLGNSKQEGAQYYDLTSKWVLGQLARSTLNGTEVSRADYDSGTGNLLSVYSFGQLQQTLSYRTDGTVASVKDGKNQTTSLSNWYRGVPKTIQFPDYSTQFADVNDKGWILSTTDEIGATTSYGYDALGRISSITLPGGDAVAWAPTYIVLTPVTTTEYGIPGGHWRRTESRGNYRKVTYYNALWQPVIQREYDFANATATQRFSGWKYDHEGRVTFAGYPLTAATSIASFTKGVRSSFDALGRPSTVSQDAENNAVLTTGHNYLDGFKTQISNPRGYSTTLSYEAFDTPDTSRPIKIVAPEGATTEIDRDAFGKPNWIKRSGTYQGNAVSATRQYFYDTYQRLCKRIEPESGATLYDYDNANNVSWMAEGTGLMQPTCNRTDVTTDKTTYSYDARNRVLVTNFPNTSFDHTYSYFADGKLQTLGTGSTYWTYTYNKRRLLTSEVLGVGPNTFAYGYGHDTLGNVTSTSYPHGPTVTATYNGLGQMTALGDYATGITYHPNGAMKGFSYGNQTVRTMTQNVRGLPLWVKETASALNGSTKILDDNYSYDANGNVSMIIDSAQNGLTTRGMEYDGLDRLTIALSIPQWGTATYAYDPLDNLRESNIQANQYRYVYDGSNRLSQLQNPTGGTIATFGYNLAGDQTSKSGPTPATYQFDSAHRLNGVIGVASYGYDGHGRRVTETPVAGATQYKIYTSDGQLRFNGNGAGGNRFIYLGNTLIATDNVTGSTATNRLYEHTDALGSRVARWRVSDNNLTRFSYAPYGANFGTAATGIGYTGHEGDSDTGLIYMQQRYYDPAIGRFLSVDPVTADGASGTNFNRYWYANNNPYRFTDPDGRLAGMRSDSRGDYYEDQLGNRRECNFCLSDGDGGQAKQSRSPEEKDYYAERAKIGERGEQTFKEVGKYVAKEAGWMLAGAGLNRFLGGIVRLFRVSDDAAKIAGGHAFTKHGNEFASLGIKTEKQFARHVDSVMANPTAAKSLERGRMAFWDQRTGTVVIRDPKSADGGTAFIPTRGIDYFNGLK